MGFPILRITPAKTFFLLGGLWGVGALAHPCPTCVAGTVGMCVRGAMEKLEPAKRWMDKTFSSGSVD